MREAHFITQGMPRVAHVLAEAAGHPHHHRRRKAVGGAPTQGAGVVELLGGRVGVLPELDFGHRHQSANRKTSRAANDALFGERGIEHAINTELLLQPLGDEMHAALLAHVLAKDHHLGIHHQLVL